LLVGSRTKARPQNQRQSVGSGTPTRAENRIEVKVLLVLQDFINSQQYVKAIFNTKSHELAVFYPAPMQFPNCKDLMVYKVRFQMPGYTLIKQYFHLKSPGLY
jgi:hypothetical protein